MLYPLFSKLWYYIRMAIDEAPQNKMVSKDEADTKEQPVLQTFFFPAEGVNIQAVDMQDALAKLAARGDNKAI